ncbi:M48 family metallopeptidase [Clostridium algidicarnis]|uniref:M48 family metallopeptidase n=1 Tax=Clostridium algidicarnis TaxID=37659 RepID=UPI001C0C8B4E|nr:SprT family zinc-dependent metalloprotease [Clostridium algidicarnis]MBU3204072.1 M48 family metallopeptidase [Clostridium algidicarnis]MBU3212226.1 M48 family metallopeptidase [Clostridium algidicarnis]MBU3221269.1 M48 family metallopeptidase [Clostridium algidicarnis]
MKESFVYKDEKIEYEIIYSKRKTMEISIKPPDKITVRVPMRLPKYKIIERLTEKGDWILKHLNNFKTIDYKPINREFINGEKLLYLGREYNLIIYEDYLREKPEVYIEEGHIVVNFKENNKADVEKSLELWYRKEALNYILGSIKQYEKIFNKKPKAIVVKEQKKRWGSCTYDNRLLFNWRCVMARPQAIDYVILHEMCHMVHKDHSKNFWNLVESIMPSYKEEKQWLKINGHKLTL